MRVLMGGMQERKITSNTSKKKGILNHRIINTKIIEWTREFPITAIGQGQSMSSITRATRTSEFGMQLESLQQNSHSSIADDLDLAAVRLRRQICQEEKIRNNIVQNDIDMAIECAHFRMRLFFRYCDSIWKSVDDIRFVLESKKDIMSTSLSTSNACDGDDETQSRFPFTLLPIVNTLSRYCARQYFDTCIQRFNLCARKSGCCYTFVKKSKVYNWMDNSKITPLFSKSRKYCDIGNVLMVLGPAGWIMNNILYQQLNPSQCLIIFYVHFFLICTYSITNSKHNIYIRILVIYFYVCDMCCLKYFNRYSKAYQRNFGMRMDTFFFVHIIIGAATSSHRYGNCNSNHSNIDGRIHESESGNLMIELLQMEI
ncbi:hypothetical protein RFI_04587 [Reticulomyxa filosa]|uniref:Uncharacterized protein n=1 Tax=Reticulomyxa filosa TaxID=46433 RepID=X6P4L1_RETFI|nr:hypothetical protein RFI_04587 [Reticulomyxa filosa]|eukprot:ETO32532.1 hypothetical protein RFI_04587 [Reticulomyxa filosa]